MDFIERLFHISPDQGSGATELLIVMALFAITMGAIFRRQIGRVWRRRG